MAGGGITLIPSYTEDNVYPAYQDRLLMKSLWVQAGVVESEDYKVSAGTGLQVNIKKGKAFVEQTGAIEESSNAFYNGLYNTLNPIEQNPYNNVEVSAVNNQIAQIVIRVYDIGELKTGGSSFARLEWINGTPNALATETKMKEGVYEGRAALPQSSLRLANILVPKNATKSSEYYIEDSRTRSATISPWLPLELGAKVQTASTFPTAVVRTENNVTIGRFHSALEVKSGQTLSEGEVAATIPLAYRPTISEWVTGFIGKAAEAGVAVRIHITTNGQITLNINATENKQIFLGGITYAIL